LRLICLAALALLQGRPAAPDDTLRIYVARHGQTEWNAVGRMQGSADIPLNENGRRQARQLADRLAGVPFDAIYSSTLQRSAQTAEAFRGRAPIQALAGLNEGVDCVEGLRQVQRVDRQRADTNAGPAAGGRAHEPVPPSTTGRVRASTYRSNQGDQLRTYSTSRCTRCSKDEAFRSVSSRRAPVENFHVGVNALVQNATFALYRDFPDPHRSFGEEKF